MRDSRLWENDVKSRFVYGVNVKTWQIYEIAFWLSWKLLKRDEAIISQALALSFIEMYAAHLAKTTIYEWKEERALSRAKREHEMRVPTRAVNGRKENRSNKYRNFLLRYFNFSVACEQALRGEKTKLPPVEIWGECAWLVASGYQRNVIQKVSCY